MNEAIVKEEVIEETCNSTFKNGEYVDVKEEEIDQKPEYLLEKEIKAEMDDDYFENNNSDEFPEDVKPEPKESDSEKVPTYVTRLECGVCQKMMPINLIKFINSNDEKTVLSENFKIEGSLKLKSPFVCYSHIQTIIDKYAGKLKFASTPFEQRLLSFITRNKRLVKCKCSKSRRRICQICDKIKDNSQLYQIGSKNNRMVIMIGCILRGTLSVEQAMPYITNKTGVTCYSHCKESIDMIFEVLGVRSIEEFSKCFTLIMDNLVDIGKTVDSNFTIDTFILAFKSLFTKNQKLLSNL
ncbi:hypothetical protein B9Z55_021154 [Caenorhabditis nigoni]|uniref:Lin-15A/B-like domain-containing protein n=1 Tax=Caenorhabditis nigoni TaxID=1611254 RepID=A0A2G5TQW4_9PELO|nr:hypothetical protein B9Z55_021154 [Caenorhabditis nigoni]